MKKLILLLITLTTISNISYASFPVEFTEGFASVIDNNPTFDWGGFFVGFLSVWLFPYSLLALPLYLLTPRGFKDSDFRRSFWTGVGIAFLLALLLLLLFFSMIMGSDFWQSY